MTERFSAIIFLIILTLGLSNCAEVDVDSGKYELKINEFVDRAVDKFEYQQRERMISNPDLANTKRAYKKTK